MRNLQPLCLAGLFSIFSSLSIADTTQVMLCETEENMAIPSIKDAKFTCYVEGKASSDYTSVLKAMQEGWKPFNTSVGNGATGTYEQGANDKYLERSNTFTKIIILLEKKSELIIPEQ
ncbi:hypothetical protein EOPP23_07035 [Endozoicomonas sp. OPT23]|uniref:hypothetical protein n=1 Tax=Endozoicomonas sp. OPT23 TaxID=2072845 RepID=UPI00189189BB|nr:hypothetical protein [Endozoicomonas sp. OPT23]MRI32740.1 hypothetical protein [Endozoicomonas sp. OPT23]